MVRLFEVFYIKFIGLLKSIAVAVGNDLFVRRVSIIHDATLSQQYREIFIALLSSRY